MIKIGDKVKLVSLENTEASEVGIVNEMKRYEEEKTELTVTSVHDGIISAKPKYEDMDELDKQYTDLGFDASYYYSEKDLELVEGE